MEFNVLSWRSSSLLQSMGMTNSRRLRLCCVVLSVSIIFSISHMESWKCVSKIKILRGWHRIEHFLLSVLKSLSFNTSFLFSHLFPLTENLSLSIPHSIRFCLRMTLQWRRWDYWCNSTHFHISRTRSSSGRWNSTHSSFIQPLSNPFLTFQSSFIVLTRSDVPLKCHKSNEKWRRYAEAVHSPYMKHG